MQPVTLQILQRTSKYTTSFMIVRYHFDFPNEKSESERLNDRHARSIGETDLGL
jgi:hypothetical protein